MPHNLDLAVRNGNKYYYFNTANWRELIQPDDQKLGVVIMKDGQNFILALEDNADGREMINGEVMRMRIPNYLQGKAWASQTDAVASAIVDYEGQDPRMGDHPRYWIRIRDLILVEHYVDIVNGKISYAGNGGRLSIKCKARAVVAVLAQPSS